MVERESALGSGSQMKERKRMHNFSAYEIEVITNNVKKNLDLIQSKLANAVTNKQKQMLWERNNPSSKCGQNSQVNSQGGKKQVEKSPQHCQERICRIQEGDQDNWRWLASKVSSIASKEIIEVLEDTPVFSCLTGFETGF